MAADSHGSDIVVAHLSHCIVDDWRLVSMTRTCALIHFLLLNIG